MNLGSVVPTLITLPAISISVLIPDVSERIAPYVMAFCILGIGIPHGALDHILYYELEERRQELPEKTRFGTWVRPLFFYINYLTIMIIWSSCWDAQPQVAFWTFLLVSSYHFGEADLDYIQGISNQMKVWLYFSRGVLLVGMTLTSQPLVTLPIIQKLVSLDGQTFLLLCTYVKPLVVTQHFLALFVLLLNSRKAVFQASQQPFPSNPRLVDLQVCLYELFRCCLFTALFWATNPLLAFSIFFGVWHSSTTIWGVIRFLKKQGHPAFGKGSDVSLGDIVGFYILAAPFTIVSIVGMMIVYQVRSVVGLDSFDPALVWAVFICCISILTGSHMWILTALHWAQVTLDPCNLGMLFGREQAKRRFKKLHSE